MKGPSKKEVERVARLMHDQFLSWMKDKPRKGDDEKVTVAFDDLSKNNREKYLFVARALILDLKKVPS